MRWKMNIWTKRWKKSLDNLSEEQCENAVPHFFLWCFLTKFEKEKLILEKILPALGCKRFQLGEFAVQIAKKTGEKCKEKHKK